MKRVFVNEVVGKIIARAELDTTGGPLTLVFTDDTFCVVSIEHGWYGESALVDDDQDAKPPREPD